MQAGPLAPPQAPPGGGGVPALTVRAGLTMSDVMHGPTNPERDLAQTGVRLPKYVMDAVRSVVVTSRGQWTMQALIAEAVKSFIPPEILHEAWTQHGGPNTPPAPGP